ncbi:MAG: phage tail tip lysozyme, partial [Cyanobacteria bacterium J06576_12]
MQSYIFGGDTGRTVEDIRRQRAVADQLRGGKPQIRTLADGINSAGRDIAAALLSRSASRKERAGTEAATQRYNDLIGSMLASPQPTASQPTIASQPLPQDEVVPGVSNTRMDAAVGGDDTRSQVAEMLLGKGYSPTVTAGLLGNIQQESNFDTSAVGDNGNSFGMAQWNGPRRHAFKAYAAEQGMDPASVEAQVGFLDHELQGSENAALQAMQGAATPEEAALIGSQKFWRPGIPHNDKRQRYAADIASLLRSPEQPAQAAQAQPAPTQPQPASAAQQPPQGGSDIAQLLMAAQDPFMSPQQQQMIGLLLQREIKEPDTMSPFQQAQMERFARQDNLAERQFQAQLDGRLNSGTSVNINNGDGLPLPKPQQGWQYIRDEQTGGVRLAPIPGGPAEREIAGAEEAATNAALVEAAVSS